MLWSIGWPTNVVTLDWETYFDSTYKLSDNTSMIEYIMDDRFEELCVATSHLSPKMDKPVQDVHTGTQIKPAIADLQVKFGDDLSGCTVVAHNAFFDVNILQQHHGIRPPYVLDTAALARAWHAWSKTGVGELARRFGLPAKGDTKEFKELTFRRRYRPPARRRGVFIPPKRIYPPSWEQVRKLEEYALNDVAIETELFVILLPLLSRPEVEIPLLAHTLGMYLDPTFVVDYARAEDLQRRMQDELDQIIDASGLTLQQVRGHDWDVRMHEAIEAADSDPRYFTKPAKNTRGWKIASAKADPERKELLSFPDETVRSLMNAKEAAGSWPNHIKRVQRIVDQSSPLGRLLPVPLLYHGAHTGRWSGGEKINLQNLGSRGHAWVSEIRKLLCAQPGRELVIVDQSAIEARGVAWIAKQDDLCEQFAAGEDIYCRFAEQVLGLPDYSIRKPNDDDPPHEARRLKTSRGLGKTGVLGCGYGMGANRAEDYARDMGAGEIGGEMAEQVVNTYRETYGRIVRFWKDIERAFVYVHRYREPVEMARGLRLHVEEEPRTKADVLIITLPSGRELKYHDVFIEATHYGPQIRVFNRKTMSRVHMWGGHLTENIVQALCRDTLSEAILTLSERHIVPLHVHDEIILDVPKGTGETVLAEAIDVLSTPPAWAAGFPMTAEGVVSTCYGEH